MNNIVSSNDEIVILLNKYIIYERRLLRDAFIMFSPLTSKLNNHCNVMIKE